MTSLSLHQHHHQLGFHHCLSSSVSQKLFLPPSIVSNFPKPNSRNLVVSQYKPEREQPETVKGKKENVWSVDNELASKSKNRSTNRGRQRGRGVLKKKQKKENTSNHGRDVVMVSGAMLMEVENVLQTQVSPFFSLA